MTLAEESAAFVPRTWMPKKLSIRDWGLGGAPRSVAGFGAWAGSGRVTRTA